MNFNVNSAYQNIDEQERDQARYCTDDGRHPVGDKKPDDGIVIAARKIVILRHPQEVGVNLHDLGVMRVDGEDKVFNGMIRSLGVGIAEAVKDISEGAWICVET